MQHLLENITQLRTDQTRIAASYENNQSYEMAYIAIWSILEISLKDISPYAKKKVLLNRVSEWKNYLEGQSNNKPKEIRDFRCTRNETIPSITLIESLIGESPTIEEILNTDAKKGTTKWRDKRNRIAHNAEEFHKLDTYQEYKNKLLNGIDELVVSLSAAIQENQ
jgi:hypothetical protein